MVSRLACSLVGQRERVTVVPGTRAALLYGADHAVEAYYCNYGINTTYQRLLETGGLVVSGAGSQGEARIVELPSHPFFVATLFLPQARRTAEGPHPLITGFAAAVAATRESR